MACRSARSSSGARRSDTLPLVVEASSWQEGVYKAATMGSETTAAAAGAVGEVRRDPFAMLPFCGYHVGDYFAHWLRWARGRAAAADLQRQLVPHRARRQVRLAGFGQNMRVLPGSSSVPRRVAESETALGLEPDLPDLNWSGLDSRRALCRGDADRTAASGHASSRRTTRCSRSSGETTGALALERTKLADRLAG
jgi:phosphoenolpyruvate carboxykinase (GTP)